MNRAALRSLVAGAGLFALLASTSATAQCVPGYCPFKVSGKKGRFLDAQITPADLARADTQIQAGLGGGRGLSDVSVNRGAAAGTGVSLPQTEAALNAMLDRIRAQWPYRMPPPVRVRILGTTRYGPTAKPDNVITVPFGLLMIAKSDDEVAWVMAHEYSHIALAHFSRETQQRALTAGVDRIVACSRVGLALTQMRARTSGGKLNFYAVEDKGIQGISASVLSRSESIGEILEIYNQNLSRRQEDQADAAGLDLAAKASYSNDGYGDALIAVENEDRRSGTVLARLQSGLTDYVKASAGQSVKQASAGGSLQDVGAKWFQGLARNGLQMLGDKALDYVKQSHRPAKDRREGLGKYLDAAYRDAAPVDPKRTWLDAVQATPEYREARTAVVARDTAKTELDALEPADAGDAAGMARRTAGVQRAFAAIRPVVGTRYAQTPLFANVLARLQDAVGNAAEADRVYDLADTFTGVMAVAPTPAPSPVRRAKGKKAPRKAPVAAPPTPVAAPVVVDDYLRQSLDGYDEHVDFLVRRGNYAKALKVIDLAKARFGDDERFLPDLVTIYAQTNRKDQLVQTIVRCNQNKQNTLKDACDAALFSPQQQAKFATLPPADQAELMEKTRYAAANARTTSTCGIVAVSKATVAED